MAAGDGNMTEADAIRRAIAEGAGGDYMDIAAAVRRRFGLIVGSRLVEEVVMVLQRDGEPQTTVEAVHPTSEPSTGARDVRNRVLSFVQEMGGFAQARAAIDALESEMRRLLP